MILGCAATPRGLARGGVEAPNRGILAPRAQRRAPGPAAHHDRQGLLSLPGTPRGYGPRVYLGGREGGAGRGEEREQLGLVKLRQCK